MTTAFREFVQKVGSGPHTSQNLSRLEAASAMRMMLLGEATPAQIGAFLIAHRIKRPTGEELAGMLDAYDEIGPKLEAVASEQPVMVWGCPYDGRSRTAPVTVLSALLLASYGQPVLLHGGDRMPTKYGIPLVEIWDELGVNWRGLDLESLQRVFEATGIGLVYLPKHFPEAANLVPYRDQLGKRPPIATLELIWSPYQGDRHLVAGFVHPPTEQMFRDALALREDSRLTTVKGLEGSSDLPRERTAIIGYHRGLEIAAEPVPTDSEGSETANADPFLRLLLHPRDYGFTSENVLFQSETFSAQMQSVLQGEPSELMESAVWSGGFYLWHSGLCGDMHHGIAQAREGFSRGRVAAKLQEIIQAVGSRSPFN
jgi:anthranilate phosphoribosyltransferase